MWSHKSQIPLLFEAHTQEWDRPMLTLDTNAIIYYLKGEEMAVRSLNKAFEDDAAVYISTITELELFSFRIFVRKKYKRLMC